jgi:predicted RNase H-related nuclease YkuK (DUF458 family)
MKNLSSRFKKFNGEFIPDIVEYLRTYIERDPTVTISVGCDSIQKRRRTIYAVTIMLYNTDIRNGAHVVFFRESCIKIRDTNERLDREAMLAYEVAEELNALLEPFYSRSDLNVSSRRAYKYHLAKCMGEYANVALIDEQKVVENISLSEDEKTREYRLIDLHLDFNPSAGLSGRNRSNAAYKKHTPWLRGCLYRVWCKPLAYAATSAADLLLQ